MYVSSLVMITHRFNSDVAHTGQTTSADIEREDSLHGQHATSAGEFANTAARARQHNDKTASQIGLIG